MSPLVEFVLPVHRIIDAEETLVEHDRKRWALARITHNGPLPQNEPRPFVHDDALIGQGTVAYVVDSGIFVDHEDFRGRARWGAVIPLLGATQGDATGHGTHVAGAIGGQLSGVARGCTLVAVKAGTEDGDYEDENLLAGVAWAINDAKETNLGNKTVINLSIKLRNNSVLNRLIAEAEEAGTVFVQSGGNRKVNVGETPATFVPTSNNFMVGNVGRDDDVISPSSNFEPRLTY